MADRWKEDSNGIESTTVGIFRTAATIKGGRRFSFGSLVVVGDRNGQVGFGYGKANEVPSAIEKAEKDGRRSLKRVALKGNTIPHTVQGRFGSSLVKLVPASPGTGVVAGTAVRAVLELAGIQDCMTKSYGSNNKKNLVKATLDGLTQLVDRVTIEELRGVDIGETKVDEMVRRGAAFAPVPLAPSAPEAEAEPPAEEAAPQPAVEVKEEPKAAEAPQPLAEEKPAEEPAPQAEADAEKKND
jgi:small subunit ribosomal protein S5